MGGKMIDEAEGRPTTPSPNKAANEPSYSLKIIKLDCGDAATNRPFIPIRKNKTTELSSVWTDGKSDKLIWGIVGKGSSNNFKIYAQFRFKNNNGNNIPVKGVVYEKKSRSVKVAKSNEVSVSRETGNDTATVAFTFSSLAIRGFSKQNFSFAFMYKDISGSWASMKSVPVTVYFIPSKPNKPWNADVKGDKQNPWTDALDKLLGWGVKGMDDQAKIATQITKYIYKSINFKYDILTFDKNGRITGGGGATRLSSGGVFDCTKFLKDVRKKRIVGNCTDCATLVRTFSNLLGSELNRKRFGMEHGYFYCNKIKTIGYSRVWQYPFPVDNNGNPLDVTKANSARLAVRGRFGYHEIAFDGTGSHTDKIYDPCLNVNEDVLKGTFKEKWSANTQFAIKGDGGYNANGKSFTSDSKIEYREMLVLDGLVLDEYGYCHSLNNASISAYNANWEGLK